MESSAGAPGLPSDCRAGALRDADGAVIDLTGQWTGTGILFTEDEVATLKQLGSCLFGSVRGEDSGILEIGNLSGPIQRDFTVDLELVMIQQQSQFKFGDYSTLLMIIEWDPDGRIRLREDREAGEVAGRCIQTTFDCPAPVIWYRVSDGPLPS